MTAPIVHLVVGTERHGVVRFGVELDAGLQACGQPTLLRRSVDDAITSGLHLQFTDRVFGGSPSEAAGAVTRIADAVHRLGRCVTVTLHDVPQPSDGTGYDDRTTSYARVCAAADGVVVSSDHERLLLAESGIEYSRLQVIPLPVASPSPRPDPTPSDSSVGVFGFLYPGKGHLEVLEAMTALPPAIACKAIGEASAGHQDLVAQLHRYARRAGRRFDVTGHVPDHRLTAVLQAVSVPVAHHRHVSASGSLNAWLAAGRRPLTPDTRYFRELAQRNPGSLTLYRDDREGLVTALVAALANPESTWLPAGSRCAPTTRTTARRYADLLRAWHQ